MANDLNRCTFIGRLGKDPELKYFQNGDAYCNVSIACGESWKDKASGEKKERTEWVNLAFSQKLAEVAAQYLKKGAQIYVEGKFTTRKWTDKEGQERYSTEIKVANMQMLGGKQDGASAGSSAAPAARPAAGKQGQPEDDDVPF